MSSCYECKSPYDEHGNCPCSYERGLARAVLKPTGEFVRELQLLLNKHSQENASNTPDFILAKYLAGCLYTWNRCTTLREEHKQ